MNSRFKIIISNKNLYKEVELSSDATQVKVGTAIDCDYRLSKELFFDSIELTLIRNSSGWTVFCSDNLYLTVGDVRKLVTMNLKHGDYVEVRYQDSNNLVFSFEFFIDFDNGTLKYERIIDISGCSKVSIGADNRNDIVLKSEYIKNDSITLTKNGSSLYLKINKSTYGVYHNGNKATDNEIIKNGDFISLANFSFYYKDNCIRTEANSNSSTTLSYRDEFIPENYPRFDRNTRIQTILDEEKIEILDPPAKQERQKEGLLMKLLPSVGMLAGAGVMAACGGMMMIVVSGISATMGIVTAVMGLNKSKKEHKEAEENRVRQYNEYIDEKKKEISSKREQEFTDLENIYISADKELDNIRCFSPMLFDRTISDADFLSVRLGTGSVKAKRTINYKKQEKLVSNDDLQNIPEQICNEYECINNAPVVCDLKSVDAVGLVGSYEDRYELFKVFVLDIISRQHYADLKLFFVAENENKDKIRWLRFTPFVLNENIGVPNIVCDDESKNVVFEYLYKELSRRELLKEQNDHIVVFFYDLYGFTSHPISKYLNKAKELNVSFVFMGDNISKIPFGCGYIVSADSQSTGTLIDAKNKNNDIKFNFNCITDRDVKKVASLLYPVYTEDISLESSLTKSISMFELLNIISVDDINLEKNWNNSQVYKSMDAPIGVSKTGIVSLNLHDKGHGPHGLVAGTTGSGKSEILQTYILSMATLFHPYEVAFVIIDFKGGGMVNQFKDLPHLLGAITNIDGKAINRSLKSIKAELQKRQRYFADADVNHIDKYIKKYKAGEVNEPLPHLIIIVDEFAELKAEQPEFMKELISAARIGRSLGVHLILATQKPAGQVNEQIWSNSRFKLCLKVQTKEDSNEVLKSPLAAEIKEPGRAYLQVGNNEIFELFQSAYSGASDKPEESSVKQFKIYSLSESGKKSLIYEQKKKQSERDNSTQLSAIVDYVHDYCDDKNINKLPDICLPALGDNIFYKPEALTENIGATVSIGFYDDPDNQYQGSYSVNLSEQNVLIIGSSQSGKTNVIQTMIRDLSTRYTPDEVNIYIIDFASMVLKNFEGLNHVGGVVTSSDDEKLKNLMKLLFAEIEMRKEKLLSAGVSSFNAYREAGNTDLPQIVLFIDNLTALKELYFQDDDTIINLCREGLSVGLSIVIANSQTSGIGYRYISNFNCKIALFCNDSSEYHSLFEHCNERIDDIHGRAIIELEKNHYECQMYLSFEGEKEYERVNEIKKYISETNLKNSDSKARLIPLIPELLTTDYVYSNFDREMRKDTSLVVGLNYSTVSPFAIDFSQLNVVAVSGKESSGKHNFFKYIMNSFDVLHKDRTEFYVFDGISRKLSTYKDKSNVVSYELLPDKAMEKLAEVEKILAKRYESVAAGDDEYLNKQKLIVLIINSYDVVEAICANVSVLNAYKNIVGKYKNMKVSVILGDFENKIVNFNSPEIFRQIRDTRHLFFFGDINSLKVFDLPLSMLREFKKPVSTGDCYYINDNDCYKIKTPLNK